MLVRGASFPLGFLLTLLLARFLGISELGVYSEALAWGSVIAIVGTVGLDRYAVREISGYSARRSWSELHSLIRKLPIYSLGFGVAAALVAFAVYLIVRRSADGGEVETFAIAIAMAPIMSLAILRQGMLQGLGRVVVSRLPEDCVRPGLFVLLLLLAFGVLELTRDSVNAMLLQAGALLASFLIGIWLLRRHLPPDLERSGSHPEPTQIVRDALPMGLFAMASALMLQVGVIVLGFTSDSDQVALYATTFKVAIAVALAEFAVNNAYQPMAASMIAIGDRLGLSRMAPRAGAGVLLLSLPISIPIFMFSGQILSLFGPEFVVGETTLRILCVSYVASQLFGQNATILMMSRNTGPLMWSTSVAVIMIVVLNLILDPIHGAEGAAISWLVAVIVWNLILSLQVKRKMGFFSTPLLLLVEKLGERR